MRRICAWCKKELSLSANCDSSIITHGICHECADNISFQLGAPVFQYLDSLNIPVLLVAHDGSISFVNNIAQNTLGASSADIAGKPGGEVFECQYARLPDGCGNTVHCSGCTIRKTVMDSFTTGRAHSGVVAYLNRREGKTRYQISTQRKGQFVALCIDNAGAEDQTCLNNN